MAKAATYNLQPMVRGDHWQGIAQIGPLLINGAVPPSPVGSARMSFRRVLGGPGPAARTISTTAGSIQIVDANEWIFTIPRQPLPLKAGKWFWDFETTSTTGVIQTYLAGSIELVQDVTI